MKNKQIEIAIKNHHEAIRLLEAIAEFKKQIRNLNERLEKIDNLFPDLVFKTKHQIEIKEMAIKRLSNMYYNLISKS